MLNKTLVNDTARGWVHQVALVVLDEEALSDALVDNNESDLGHLTNFVVHFFEGLTELNDLLLDDLLLLSITDSITVDDVVSGEHAVMERRKDFDGLLERLFHLVLDDLLTLLLDNVFRVVLAHLLVCAGCKTNDRRRSSVADIDSNQHCTMTVHRFRELQVEQVTLDLGVNLSENVAGLAHVKLVAVARGDHLRGDLKLVEELLVHAVVVLVSKDYNHNLRMTEVSCRTCHHVLEKFLLDLSVIVLRIDFNESGLFNLDLEHTTGLLERVEDVVRDLEVRALSWVWIARLLIDHHPLLMTQVYSLLNWSTLEGLLVALNNLVVEQKVHLRSTEHKTFQLDRNLFDLKTPVLHSVLLGKRVDHLLDLINLLLRRNTSHGQGISHTSTLADGIRDTVEKTELRGQVVLLLTVLDQEAWLVEVSHGLAIGTFEVLGDSHFSIVPGERGVRRSLLEVDVLHVVSALVAPICDD